MDATVLSEGVKAVIGFFAAGIGATIVLLMPGYLLSSAYNRNRRGPAPSEREFIAGSAVGAIVVHLLALPWTAPLLNTLVRDGVRGNEWQIGLWALVTLILVPTLLGMGLGVLADVQRPAWLKTVLVRSGLSSAARTPQAWDWVFSRGFPAYVRVRLTDGRTVFGLYSSHSFASSDSAGRDLYLQQQWMTEDGWFAAPYPQSMGVWLSGSSIVSIEFFDGRPAEEGEPDG